ncbi:hypothetical protein SARC_08273, partial [Sphaeroforma arctica JP610]
ANKEAGFKKNTHCHEAELTVCFISNPERKVPVWYQKITNDIRVPMIWDYHVVLLSKCSHTPAGLVYDFDSVLPFPCDGAEYAKLALQISMRRNPCYYGYYRLVPLAYFMEHFGSDRSHMIRADGTWSAPPPVHPCIKPELNNLDEYISMRRISHCEEGSNGTIEAQTLSKTHPALPILELVRALCPLSMALVEDREYIEVDSDSQSSDSGG